MAKVKISKKSTRIDMTAMCDVAFLLLSFFIMTATAKQPEPKPVDAPHSTIEDKLPEEGVATITVGDKQVFFSLPADIELRRKTLERMSTKHGVPFTEEQYKTFEGMAGFGVPLSKLPSLMALSVDDRNKPNVQEGIPYDSVKNQLGDWVKFARQVNDELQRARIDAGEKVVRKDLDIAIKGDAKEDYTTVKRIIDILQDQDKNKFFLVTGLRNEDF
jgi:biopolymer transport protein ExbD